MERKIESLLRLVGDMKRFEEGEADQQKRLIRFPSEELSDEELDFVAAAAQDPTVPKFPWEEKK